MNDTQFKELEPFVQELRRGTVVLAVLSELREEQYGYSLKKKLNDKGFRIDEGTLYPLLRRLEAQGLLASRWQVEESRPRRYYSINDNGLALLGALGKEWKEQTSVMERILP